MNISPLQRLPAEIRVAIYELVLQHHEPIVYHPYDWNLTEKDVSNQDKDLKPLFPITRTCRSINHECSTLFYQQNTFQLPFRYGAFPFPTLFPRFQSFIGYPNASALRHVQIKYSTEISLKMDREILGVFPDLVLQIRTFATSNPKCRFEILATVSLGINNLAEKPYAARLCCKIHVPSQQHALEEAWQKMLRERTIEKTDGEKSVPLARKELEWAHIYRSQRVEQMLRRAWRAIPLGGHLAECLDEWLATGLDCDKLPRGCLGSRAFE